MLKTLSNELDYLYQIWKVWKFILGLDPSRIDISMIHSLRNSVIAALCYLYSQVNCPSLHSKLSLLNQSMKSCYLGITWLIIVRKSVHKYLGSLLSICKFYKLYQPRFYYSTWSHVFLTNYQEGCLRDGKTFSFYAVCWLQDSNTWFLCFIETLENLQAYEIIQLNNFC